MCLLRDEQGYPLNNLVRNFCFNVEMDARIDAYMVLKKLSFGSGRGGGGGAKVNRDRT